MKIKSYILALLACTAFVGCDNDDEYTPAEKPASDCMTVYFDASNVTDYILTPEEVASSPSVTLTVSRENTDKAATIPVIVEYKADVFDIPTSVSFEQGAATANLVVSFPNIESFKTSEFSIRLGDDYVNPYVQVNGSDKFHASILVSQWTPIFSDVNAFIGDYYGNTASGTSAYKNTVYWLEGLNKFCIKNFLNTGIDLQFSIVNDKFDVNDRSTWTGAFNPLNNMDTSSWGSPYYILADNEGNTLEWTIAEGDSKGITTFALYDPTNTSYAGADLTTATGCYIWGNVYNYFSDGTGGWYYLLIY